MNIFLFFVWPCASPYFYISIVSLSMISVTFCQPQSSKHMILLSVVRNSLVASYYVTMPMSIASLHLITESFDHLTSWLEEG